MSMKLKLCSVGCLPKVGECCSMLNERKVCCMTHSLENNIPVWFSAILLFFLLFFVSESPIISLL